MEVDTTVMQTAYSKLVTSLATSIGKQFVLISIVMSIVIISVIAARFFTNWLDKVQKSPDQSGVISVVGFTGFGFLEQVLLFMMAMLYIVYNA